jgi:tetratricopeptide (TPR) repeat protein
MGIFDKFQNMSLRRHSSKIVSNELAKKEGGEEVVAPPEVRHQDGHGIESELDLEDKETMEATMPLSPDDSDADHEEDQWEEEDDSLSFDTRSMLSDGFSSEVDVKSGFSELSRVLGQMELEVQERDASMQDHSGHVPLEKKQASFDRMKDLVKVYNDLAVGYMESKDFDESLSLLNKAESLLLRIDDSVYTNEEGGHLTTSRLSSMTFNNLGCLYRRMSHPESALKYLEKALDIEDLSGTIHERASTHLNLSASHSVLHHEKESLYHGEKAIILLQSQLWPGCTFQDGLVHILNKLSTDGKSQQILSDCQVLAMAYHNVGTQHERLNHAKEARVSFSRACTIGLKILGQKSATTAALVRAHKQYLHREHHSQTYHHHYSSAKHGNASSGSQMVGMSKSKSHTTLKVRQSGSNRLLGGSKSSATTQKSKVTRGRGTLPFTSSH